MKRKVIGFESANSFVKVFGDGGEKPAVYPNTVSRAAIVSSDKLAKGTAAVYELEEFPGEYYNVGQTLGYITSSSEGIERYSSKFYKIESLIAISQFAKHGDNITVCTGIPSNHYDNQEEAARLITESLKGPHTLQINGEEVTFTVKTVIVTLQPLATFFYSIIDEKGNSDEEMIERFTETETIVIDIGWKSTDVAIMYGSGLKEHFDVGVSMQSAYERILKRLKRKYPKEDISTANIELLELEKHLRTKDVFKYGNKQYVAGDLKQEVFKEVAEEIFTKVNAIRSIKQFNTVMISGGGAIALTDSLVPLLSDDSGNLKDNVYIWDSISAQVTNAYGYYVFAKYLQD